ncbi:hypothetical protein CVT24_001871 [Panaeolus cyanescens]|uniref:STAS domain-containing protein n=1 Tax=Panaeolus cyanescens TaxID=181874 RepID=A0A409YEM6_9AGAR|nr:hypothetical protein CVT24_001871 [Panaeolus cyanescens]
MSQDAGEALRSVQVPHNMFRRAISLAKRVVGHPENAVPTVSSTEWMKNNFNVSERQVQGYLIGLFPITSWITRYNAAWISGDLIAGLTVGMVVVPQGMSYAQLALLPPEYGLYTSFVGVLIYSFFATSKDVSIGPVAVMSIVVSQVIKRVEAQHPGEWDRPQIATVLSFITGIIVLGIGLLRLGWIVEFIPTPAVSGFMTGSAISIAVGQLPGLMGISGVNTRTASYKVIIDTIAGLSRSRLDAAWGVSGLVALYLIRYICTWGESGYLRRKRVFFFITVFRNAFVMILLTLAAWLYCRTKEVDGKYPIKILLTVPAGFKHVAPPKPDSKLLETMAPDLPLATIILLLEHIAISLSTLLETWEKPPRPSPHAKRPVGGSKTIEPFAIRLVSAKMDEELKKTGPFLRLKHAFGRLNGYTIDPSQELIAIGATGIIGSCLGAYPATGSFSRSALKSKSGVRTPLAGVVTAIVVVVALYGLTDAFFWIPTAGLSAIIIHNVIDLAASPQQAYSYWRVSPPEFCIWMASVLVTVFSSIETGIYTSIGASLVLLLLRISKPRSAFLGRAIISEPANYKGTTREVFLPLSSANTSNAGIDILPPSPGVLIYRFEESYLYPNCSIFNSVLVSHVKKNIQRGRDMTDAKPGDRPWNDPGHRRSAVKDEIENRQKPVLRAIVLDFSTVSHIDMTAIQTLVDTRREIEKWTGHNVEFHFATVLSPWIKRALIAGGFGMKTPVSQEGLSRRHPLQALDDVESAEGVEKHPSTTPTASSINFISSDTPFFHIDISAAVASAERTIAQL